MNSNVELKQPGIQYLLLLEPKLFKESSSYTQKDADMIFEDLNCQLLQSALGSHGSVGVPVAQ